MYLLLLLCIDDTFSFTESAIETTEIYPTETFTIEETQTPTQTATATASPIPDYRNTKLCICRDASCLNCAYYEQALTAEQLGDFISNSPNRKLDISLADDTARSSSVQLFSSRINSNTYLREIQVTSRGARKSLLLMFPASRKEKLRPKLTLHNVDCTIAFTEASLLEEKTAMITNLDAKEANITVEGIVIVDFLETDLYSINNIAVVIVYQCELEAYDANKLIFGEGGIVVQSKTLSGTILSGGYPEIDIELMNDEITLVPTSGTSIIMNRIELELKSNTKLYAYGWGNVLNANALDIKHDNYQVNVTTDDSASVLQFGFDGRGDVYVNGVLTIYHSKLSGGAIAGIVIACIAFVIIVVAIVLAVISSRRKRNNDLYNHNQVDQALDLATV